MDTASPSLHGSLEPLSSLLGVWTGEGEGTYPTIEPFVYGEELRFWHVGKPFLAYSQRTWSLPDKIPLHSEMGYWRIGNLGRIELLVAHPTGIVEVDEGSLEVREPGHGEPGPPTVVLSLASTCIGLSATAKEVRRLVRRLEVEGSMMKETLDMEAVGEPLGPHLKATLTRVASHP